MKKLSLFLVFFILAGLGTLPAQVVNNNGGFEDATPGPKGEGDVTNWYFGVAAPAQATFEITTDESMEGLQSLRVVTELLGSNAWDLQVVNDPFVVEPGVTYNYSVWVKADIEGPVINFTVGNPSYAEWGRLGQVAMTTEWKKIEFQFTTPAGADTGRAPIHLGESANAGYIPITYYFDDLRIEKAGATGVDQDVALLPNSPELFQNYPNPFNPSTSIKFSLVESGNIHLYLTNLMGEVVKEITSGNYSAGVHTVNLNASDLSSGIYFYKLEAGTFSSTKKLILMK